MASAPAAARRDAEGAARDGRRGARARGRRFARRGQSSPACRSLAFTRERRERRRRDRRRRGIVVAVPTVVAAPRSNTRRAPRPRAQDAQTRRGGRRRQRSTGGAEAEGVPRDEVEGGTCASGSAGRASAPRRPPRVRRQRVGASAARTLHRSTREACPKTPNCAGTNGAPALFASTERAPLYSAERAREVRRERRAASGHDQKTSRAFSSRQVPR